MAKGLKVSLIVFVIILVLLVSTVGVYFFWPWHRDFFKNADEEFDIPGLDTEFCPQGMTELLGYNKYLISGYMDDGSASRFYVINAETKEVEKFVTLKINGKNYNGHAGGVASYNDSIWTVSYENEVGYAFRFKVSDVLNANNGDAVELRDKFKTQNRADYVFVHDNFVWVGEFYKPKKYETAIEHHIETRNGEINRAMIYGFEIKENSSNGGIFDTYPAKAISVGDQCQGIAITKDGHFVVSTSYSIPNSKIYYYEDILNQTAHGTFKPGTKEISLWYLDGKSLINEEEIPSMSEELFVKNDRVYILFESACKKYKLYNRTRLDSVYSVPVKYFAES